MQTFNKKSPAFYGLGMSFMSLFFFCDIFCHGAKKYFSRCSECSKCSFLVCYNYTGESGGWTLSHRQKKPPRTWGGLSF
nr:MAG TPA: hypothetical protein [Caudoviricetes sp.]